MALDRSSKASFEGEPLLVLERSWMVRILVSITLLPGALLCGLGAVACALEKPPELMTAIIFGTMAIILGGAYAILFLLETGRRTRLYERGIEQTRRSAVATMPYDEIREVWLRAIKIQLGGVVGVGISAAVTALRNAKGGLLEERSTNITLRLVGDGPKLKITSGDRGVARAFEEIVARVNPRLVQEALASIASGRPARFGKISISADGVSFGSRAPIALADIERLYVDGGRVLVKREGKWLRKGNVAVGSVPNVLVLLEVFASITDTPIDMPKPGGLAMRAYA